MHSNIRGRGFSFPPSLSQSSVTRSGRQGFVSCILLVFFLVSMQTLRAQPRREDIYSDYVLYPRRVALEKDLRERIIAKNFLLPLDSNSEDKFLSACWAVTQFLFSGPEVQTGFQTLFRGYDSLSPDTRIAFLEAVYAVAPGQYGEPVRTILDQETDPKLFAICALYLYRDDTSTDQGNALKIRMAEKFPGYDTIPVLVELQDYLSYHGSRIRSAMPDPGSLFAWQRTTGKKIIYSFQRWNRDYPGLAIVQDASGRFLRHPDGSLQVFRQLARSGPDLPYFITNGSTPQGVYSIQGTDVSRTNFIGPTPNFQLLLPFESSWDRYFQIPADSLLATLNPSSLSNQGPGNSAASPTGASSNSAANPSTLPNQSLGNTAASPLFFDSLRSYLALLPPSWRNYTPMLEAWSAGRIGRTEIIAHGTTIDPEYYKDRPFYPLTPTMGCLCAKELWNPTTGHLLVSEQYNLLSAFLSTPGKQGLLYVINLDDQRKPVTAAEIEALVRRWESRNK